MKEISKEKVEQLINKNIIRNTVSGLVDKNGRAIGYYRTKNKRYIEDKFADWNFNRTKRRKDKNYRGKVNN